MKSSIEEIKVKPQYVFKLELTQEEFNFFYLALDYKIDPNLQGRLKLSDDDFKKAEEINLMVFNAVRNAVSKSNEYWEA